MEPVHRHPAQREIIDAKKYRAEIDREKDGQEPPRLRLRQLTALPSSTASELAYFLPAPIFLRPSNRSSAFRPARREGYVARATVKFPNISRLSRFRSPDFGESKAMRCIASAPW